MPSAAAEPTLPVLSYAEALQSPTTFIPLLRSTLLTSGFLYLSDLFSAFPHWQEDLDAAFEVSRAFFALPEEEKRAIAMGESRHFRGYSAVGEERTKGVVDLREQIDLGPETESFPSTSAEGTAVDPIYLSLYGPNLYPSSLPSFAPTIAHYRSHLETIARVLLQLIAESLTPNPSLLTAPFESTDPHTPAYSRMKVVNYPTSSAGPEEEGALGVGAHADGGGITLLAQDEVGGLQVQRWDTGEWIDVLPRRGELPSGAAEPGGR